MTQKKYTIKEVSELLDIPKATIRYWDSQGLIHTERNKENSYREFPMQVVMELSNIAFFRNIDIPIRELKLMLESDLRVQRDTLEEAGLKIDKEMEELRLQKERILKQKAVLNDIGRLQNNRLTEAMPLFARIVAFEREREAHWKRMIEDPGAFVLLFDSKDSTRYRYGIGYEESKPYAAQESETEIWARGETAYLEGLLITDTYSEGENNLNTCVKEAERSGKRAGTVIAQYLTSGIRGEDQEMKDYYRMWIEVSQNV